MVFVLFCMEKKGREAKVQEAMTEKWIVGR